LDRIICAAALCLAAALPAWAGRPLQTEDAGVLERGACELEAFGSRESAPGTTARGHAAQTGCGVGAATQLALGAAHARVDGERARSLELGGKTRLWQGHAVAAGEAPAITLAYALSWISPDEHGWRRGASALQLVHSRMLTADWALHANVGHVHNAFTRRRATTWALAVEAAATATITPMAEVFGDDRDAPWWNVGVRVHTVADRLFVDASFGRQMATGRPRLTTLGVKVVF
jgi:hypothetical protein